MGEVASCDKCRYDGQDRKATSSRVHVKKLAFDAGHEEELVDPKAICKSWDPIQQPTNTELCESAREELPSLLRSPKKQQSTYKDECRLSFRLDPAAGFGVLLVTTTPSWPRTALPLLVVRSVELDSAFARDLEGRIGILPGDAVLEVNGCRGSPDELHEAFQQVTMQRETSVISVTVRPRPLAFNVNLHQNGSSAEKLGIAVVIDKAHPSCVRVQAVHEHGLIPSWNAAHPLLCVCPGDLVAEVNRISGDAAAMCQEIQDQTKCQSGSLIFHVLAKTGRGGKETCPPRACGAVAPWRALMQSLDEGSKSSASGNPVSVKSIWDSSPMQRASRFRM